MNNNDNVINTKEHIRECAIELFKTEGYENVTIMQICKAAGITKRTFYYHYTAKNDLLTGVNDSLGIKAEKLLESMATQKSNIETLWTLMSVYCHNSEKYGPNIIRQLYIQILSLENKEDFPYDSHLFNISIQLIKNAQMSNEIPLTSDAKNIAFTLYHTFRSVTITWASENGKFKLSEEFLKCFVITLGLNKAIAERLYETEKQ